MSPRVAQRLKRCADNYSHRLLSAVDAIPSGGGSQSVFVRSSAV